MVFGDSIKVIEKMIQGYCTGSSSCRRIYEHISLLGNPPLIGYYHVKKGNNLFANKLANNGASNNQGVVVYDNNIMFSKCVP